MKRKLLIAIPAAAILLVAAVVLFVLYGTRAAPVQRWIASQLGAVTEQYLNPRLSFKALHYRYPYTATLEEVRLVADDPARPGRTVDIFVARGLTLEMAEIPRSGQPLRIRKLILDRPQMRVVAVGEHDSRLVGYSGFLKDQSAGSSDSKLSDVFEIRLIEVVDGLLVYDPRTTGERPMEIDQINFRLDVEPVKGAETGWYAMAMNLERPPVFATRFVGRLNTDTMAIEAQSLRLTLTLGRDQDHYLPPAIQALLKEHEVSGNLVVEASGAIRPDDWQAAGFKAEMKLTGGNFAMGEHRIPLDRLDARWTMAERRGKLELLDANLLGGRLEARGEVGLSGAQDSRFDVHLTDLRLEQCLRGAASGDSKYRGALSGEITWTGPRADPLNQSQGGGTVRVVDGDLSHVPVVSAVLGVVTRGINKVGLGSSQPHDTADAEFTFEGNRVHLKKVNATTQLAALRGDGDIYFDGRLNLLVNAGSVERVQSLLGKVGSMLGRVTDEISAYTVTGTLSQPKVGVTVAPNL